MSKHHQSWEAGFESRLSHTLGLKNGTCDLSSLALAMMDGCKEMVRVWCSYWL